ncbi:Hypothetical predicted protein [Pelobates cultripes]|uniref:Uncharacterized protein n=1 Tax=Pelobates cultripes TaxID=61616 RepID=A0AAD1VRC4_PELCU|nr:Hypothetical predicted protein [Pelobates cultripes]
MHSWTANAESLLVMRVESTIKHTNKMADTGLTRTGLNGIEKANKTREWQNSFERSLSEKQTTERIENGTPRTEIHELLVHAQIPEPNAQKRPERETLRTARLCLKNPTIEITAPLGRRS